MYSRFLFSCLATCLFFSSVQALADVICNAQCVGYYQVWGPGEDELKTFDSVTGKADSFIDAFNLIQKECARIGKEALNNRLDSSSWQIFLVTAISFSSTPNRSLNATYASPMNSCFKE